MGGVKQARKKKSRRVVFKRGDWKETSQVEEVPSTIKISKGGDVIPPNWGKCPTLHGAFYCCLRG